MKDRSGRDRRRSPGRAGMAGAASLFVLLAAVSSAQDNPLLPNGAAPPPSLPPKESEEPKMQEPLVELDMRQMLTATDLTPTEYSDGLWKLRGRPGTRLVLVPVRVEPGELAYQLSTSTLNLRGGRLLAWRVPQSRTDKPAAGVPPKQDNKYTFADDPPHITRSVTVLPDGSVQWEMDRTILGGEVAKGGSIYLLRLNPQQLQDLRPKRPAPPLIKREPPRPGTTSRPTDPEQIRQRAEAERQARLQEAKRLRDEREKYQAALAEYRHELADFSGLTKRLNALPDEFERPNPDHVWAIFELSDRMASLEITGPSPLPWAIDLEQLATMRRLANNKQLTSVKELPAAVADDVRSMLALVKVSPHPFNLRGAAYALRLSGAAHLVAEGSDLYELVDAIVAGPDGQARHTLYAALIRAPETPAVAALIKQATRYFTPAEQVEAVQARLEFDPKIQKDVDSAIQTANDTLAQPNNVSPADVLSALMRFAPKDNDALLKELANKVTFSSIPAAQQDDAIVFVVGQAPFDPLAARWLDAQLLSSTQASLVSRTLEVLANATHGDDDDQPEQPAAEPTGSRPPPSLANVPRVRLKGRIEVDSVDHGLFRVLSHPDARIRDIAWRAVRHFAIAEQWRRSEEPAMAHTNPYERLTDAAIDHRPTPTYAVKFLYSQPDALRAVEGVVRILLKGDADASELAARTVLGWNAPLDIVLDARSYTDREAFAQIIYDRLQQQKPLVTGLFAERIEKNPVVPWFGKQVMQGEVPAPSQYIDAYARPERLMELLSLKEEKVALGAFAALVAATGGDDLTARQYWPNIEKQTDKSVPSLRLVWVQTQREIVADVRRRLSGPYQLLITAPPNAEPGNPIANDPPIDLGQVDLVVTELGVKLQDKPMTLNIPQDENRMILRMERPAELKQNFTAPALYKVPIQRVLEALDLTLQNDGSWRGTAEIPGEEYSVVVTMKPLRTTP